MKKMSIELIIEIDGSHLKSFFVDVIEKKCNIVGNYGEIKINLSSKELLENIVKNIEVKDLILSYLKNK